MSVKKQTKKDLEKQIAELENKLNKLSKRLETKPAETKPSEVKPAETKPSEQKSPSVTIQDALETAYNDTPMTDFHKYRATVTGYSPAPNRYFVRKTAPVGRVSTTNWNDQKIKVTGYTAPSNQYFATRTRLAYHPPDKMFGRFSGVPMTLENQDTQNITTQQESSSSPPSNDTNNSNEEKLTNTEQQPQTTNSTETKLIKEIAESLVGKKLEILVYGDNIVGTANSINLVNTLDFLRMNTKKGSVGFPINAIKEWTIVDDVEKT